MKRRHSCPARSGQDPGAERAAVALDAFILRTVLVLAMMHLFGDANWWLPGWLDRRLPNLDIEGESLQKTHPDSPQNALTSEETASRLH